MDSYLIPILVFSLGVGCWALFQLWTGRQADGSTDDQEDGACGDCGAPCDLGQDSE
ncbi:MAG: hypothetical protein QGG54_13050 [Gammaproteobacteria bacterium]|nr:hypothetical protein [Gammaproteobacteria bacterium]